jgi:uncharacterized protein YndB with AHSA1/START domain
MNDPEIPPAPTVDARELSTSRLVEAPPEAVFAAIRSPVALARWWGPKGFTNNFQEFEFSPGGRWRFVMHGPDGGHFANESVFRAIVPNERVVIEHRSSPRFELTITLTPEPGGTRVGWVQRFPTPAERDRIATYAAEANEQNLDRLAEYLGERAPARARAEDPA